MVVKPVWQDLSNREQRKAFLEVNVRAQPKDLVCYQWKEAMTLVNTAGNM